MYDPLIFILFFLLKADSGSVDHAQRFSEQLVLCAKAATVLKYGYRRYQIETELSVSSCGDSSDSHASGMYHMRSQFVVAISKLYSCTNCTVVTCTCISGEFCSVKVLYFLFYKAIGTIFLPTNSTVFN